MRIIAIIFSILLLTACSVFKAESPSQRYYALKSDYERVLITAVAYKRNCDAKPETDSCHGNVSKIQEINGHIAGALSSADTLGLQNASTELDAALIAAGAGISELSTYLLKLE